MKIERRDFFKILSVGAIAATSSKPLQAREWQFTGRLPKAPALLYDSTLCIGCKACEVGCKTANGLDADHSDLEKMHGVDKIWDSAEDLDTNSWLKIKLYKDGDASVKDREKDGFAFMRSACMHCVEPDCQSVCPTSALLKDPETGIVSWDIDACCGCRYCQVACPYLVPKFEFEETFPKLQKCILCEHRLKEGQITGCSESCPTGATLFGEYEDLLAEAKKRTALNEGDVYDFPVHTLKSGKIKPRPAAKYINHVYGEKEGGGTQYIVISSVPFTKLGLPKLTETSSSSKSEKLQHALYQGMIAPVVLFGGLAAAAFRNVKKQEKEEQGGDHE